MKQNVLKKILTKIQNNDCSYKEIDLKGLPLSSIELDKLYTVVKKNNIVINIVWDKKQSLNDKTILIEEAISQSNNKGIYPSDYIYGLLSSTVYGKNSQQDKLSSFVNKNAQEYLQNWRVKHVFNDIKSGYYGVIYAHDKTCNYVLAHRGTLPENSQEIFFGASDISTDLKEVLQSKIGSQNLQSYFATEYAIELSKNDSYYLSTTGHSLGGWLAELTSYYMYRIFSYAYSKAVVFDSPGAVQIMQELESNIKTSQADLKGIEVTTYMSMPNMINSCNSHLGKVYRLFPKLNLTTWQEIHENYTSKIPGMEGAEYNLAGYLTLLGHSLDLILNEFDPQRGFPKTYKRMTDWPCTICASDYKMSSVVQDKSSTILNSILEATLGTVLGKITGKILEDAVDALVKGSSVTHISNLLYDVFVSGKLKQSQYWQVFERQLQYELKGTTSEDQKNAFYLTYRGHYKEEEVNLHRTDIFKDSNKIDLTLYLLREKLMFLERLSISKFLRDELIEIANQYLLEMYQGKMTIVMKYDSKLNVIEIRDKIKKISMLFSVADELLNINAIADTRVEHLYFESRFPYFRDKNFIGRSEIINNIDKLFSANDIVSIDGSKGVGKTAVAMEYGYKCKQDQWLVRWFNSEKFILDNEYRNLAENLGFLIESDDQEKIRFNIYKKLYNIDQKILFIFDDVQDKELLEFYLKEKPDNIKLLITTTNQSVALGSKITLNAFSDQEALRYVTTNIDLDDTSAKDLIKATGNIPLKINAAVNYLNANKHTTVANYIADLVTQDQSQEVSPIFQKTFDIADEVLGDNKLKMLSYLSLLAHSKIPLEFMELNFSQQELNNLILFGKKLSIFEISDDHSVLSMSVSLQQELLNYLEIKYGHQVLIEHANELAIKLNDAFINLDQTSTREQKDIASLYSGHAEKLLSFEDLDESIKKILSLKLGSYLMYYSNDYTNGVERYENNLNIVIEENLMTILQQNLADAYAHLSNITQSNTNKFNLRSLFGAFLEEFLEDQPIYQDSLLTKTMFLPKISGSINALAFEIGNFVFRKKDKCADHYDTQFEKLTDFAKQYCNFVRLISIDTEFETFLLGEKYIEISEQIQEWEAKYKEALFDLIEEKKSAISDLIELGNTLGWNEDRMEEEIRELDENYRDPANAGLMNLASDRLRGFNIEREKMILEAGISQAALMIYDARITCNKMEKTDAKNSYNMLVEFARGTGGRFEPSIRINKAVMKSLGKHLKLSDADSRLNNRREGEKIKSEFSDAKLSRMFKDKLPKGSTTDSTLKQQIYEKKLIECSETNTKKCQEELDILKRAFFVNQEDKRYNKDLIKSQSKQDKLLKRFQKFSSDEKLEQCQNNNYVKYFSGALLKDYSSDINLSKNNLLFKGNAPVPIEDTTQTEKLSCISFSTVSSVTIQYPWLNKDLYALNLKSKNTGVSLNATNVLYGEYKDFLLDRCVIPKNFIIGTGMRVHFKKDILEINNLDSSALAETKKFLWNSKAETKTGYSYHDTSTGGFDMYEPDLLIVLGYELEDLCGKIHKDYKALECNIHDEL